MKLVYLFLIICTVLYFYKTKKSYTNVYAQPKYIKKDILHGLKVMDKIFNSHNIYYTIGYGTLLGAVRHHDMIEWDDDADIHILKEDIDKIMSLKDEFLKYGITLAKEWKLLKLYFNDKKYPFIDLFPIHNEGGKTKRCIPTNYSNPKKCTQIFERWWTSWYGFPYNWLIQRKKLKFGNLNLWAPSNYLELLKFWYGNKCLTECYTSNFDHITGRYIKPKLIKCLNLPKPQIV
jgi:hypothetical protein|uniref:LicD/FKTN/FKRP nucleotidyltransferase domain-containing protein n=1 Tax=viral metagenome TaxID=1070528 RepID=A0A6C0ISV8_9ZZZZ